MDSPHPPSFSTSAALPPRGGSPSMGMMGMGMGGQQGMGQDTRTQLFVSNLPFRVRWQDLKDLMRKCGTVLRADVALSPTDGRSRGFGVVLFASHGHALRAIQTYHNQPWQTRILDVRIDAQDPTGALALAEVNRAAAGERERERERRGREGERARSAQGGGVGGYGGTMLVPVPVPVPVPQGAGHGQPQGYLVPPPPPPLPQSSSAPPGSPETTRPSSSAAASPSPFLQPNPSQSSSSSSSSQPATASPSPALTSPAAGPAALPPSDIPPQLQLAAAASAASSLPQHQQHPHPQPNPQPPRHQSPPSHQQQPPQQQQIQYIPVPVPVSFFSAGAQIPLSGGVGVHPMGYAIPAPGAGVPPQLMMAAGGPAGAGAGGGMGGGVHGGLMGYYAAQQRSQSASPHPHQQQQQQYTNRHLFVGNLPFNTQWQELKDLMRGAGSVLRADIAQGPDGRSRGFGSVLFATPQDAERAVQMFNQFEFNGRCLKVHFDKFSGAGVNGGHPQSNGPSHSPSPAPYPYPPPPPPQFQQQHSYPAPSQHSGQQQQQFAMPVPLPPSFMQRTASGFEHQQQQQQRESPRPQSSQLSGGAGLFAHAASPPPSSVTRSPALAPPQSIVPEAAPRPSTASERPATSGAPGDGAPAFAKAPSPPLAASSSPPAGEGEGALPASAYVPQQQPPPPQQERQQQQQQQQQRHHPTAPSRIAMPPPLPFTLNNGLGGGGGGGPFSPLHTRNLPPMTPSMPAFTFAPFAAPTPPLHPHALFSPGVGVGVGGPFSPGIAGPGSPFFGPGPGQGGAGGGGGSGQQFPQTPGWAQTPGAQYNPMFPPFSQQQYPPQMQQHPLAYHQEQHAAPQEAEQQGAQSGTPTQENGASLAGTGTGEPSYFPPIAAPSPPADRPEQPRKAASAASALPILQQPPHASSAPARSPEVSSAQPPRPGLAGHSHSDPSGLLEAGVRAMNLAPSPSLSPAPAPAPSLSPSPAAAAFGLGGTTAAPGWAEGLSPPLAAALSNGHSHVSEVEHPAALATRRKSFIPPPAGDASERLEVPSEGGAAGAEKEKEKGRRASFDAGARAGGGGGAGGRPAFGTSIWG
ncbi:hypothetical protein JCM10213v2_003567 [Rhodosporidiobolus nylandii]